MPIYQPGPENDAPETLRRHPYKSFACSLLHFGPIALYQSRAILNEDLDMLRTEGFDVVRLNARRWAKTPGQLHDDLEEALKLPDYYGRNLDALSECLRSGDRRRIPDDGGLVVVIEDADSLNASWFRSVLDVFADAARFLQVFGQTLLVLLQSNDPDLELGGFGETTAFWNQKEWLRSNRTDE